MNSIKLLSVFLLVTPFLGMHSAQAYDVTDSMEPTDLTITVNVNTQPIHNNFTRYLTFKNLDGDYRRVAVAFTKTSYLWYEGKVTPAGLTTLQTLVPRNNRSYWDTMYF